MATNFYTQEDTLTKLDMTPEQLKDAVRNGQLREFRDGETVKYKIAEVDKIAAAAQADDLADSGLGGSVSALDMLGTGELELKEDSGEDAADSAAELRFAGEDEADPVAAAPAAEGVPPADAGASGSISLVSDAATSGESADATGTGASILEPEAEGDSGIKLGTGADAAVVPDGQASRTVQKCVRAHRRSYISIQHHLAHSVCDRPSSCVRPQFW